MDGIELGEVLVDLPDRTCRVAWFGGRKAIAKFDASEERWHREDLALRSAASGGVRVPEVVRSEPGALLLAWVDGRPLGDDDAEWCAVGEQLRSLHDLAVPDGLPRFDLDAPSWVDFLRTWVRRESALCVEMGALESVEAASIREMLLARIAAMAEPPRVFLHGDCAVQHVIVDEISGAVTLIDWGDAGTGDPLWDLAVLLLFHPEHEEAVLEGYRADDGLRARAAAELDVLRLVRFLGEITWLVEHGIAPTGSVAGTRETFARLSDT